MSFDPTPCVECGELADTFGQCGRCAECWSQYGRADRRRIEREITKEMGAQFMRSEP